MIGLQIEGRRTLLDIQIDAARMGQAMQAEMRDLAQQYMGILRGKLSQAGSGKQYGGSAGRRTYSRQRRKGVVFGRAVNYLALVRGTTPTRAYRASAPGQPPAAYTGTLRNSVRMAVRKGGWNVKVYEDKGVAWYRHFLEFGTKERFMRRKSGAAVASSHFRGNKRGKGGAGKSVGRVLPRPVISPLQVQLMADLERKISERLDAFAANRR